MPQNEEKELLAKAKKGNADAMFELANLYSFEGRDADAKYWYKKAAKCGHSTAKQRRKGFKLPSRPSDGCGVGCTVAILFVILLFVVLCVILHDWLEAIKWTLVVIVVVSLFMGFLGF